MQTVRHVVAGTDFSPCAHQALTLALRLAEAAHARVTVVHVCAPDSDEQAALRCSQTLAALLAKHGDARVELNGVLRCGLPWKKLDNVATEVGASVIVIGRHGAGCSAGLGTVADQLVRSAHRSVLLVDCDFDCLGDEAFANKQP
jgi:nucleotide-binding universal stress UspA family protein